MALNLPTHLPVAAARIDIARSSTTTAATLATASSGFSADPVGGRSHAGSGVCLQGPVLKSRVNSVRQQESLSPVSSSSYQSAPLGQHRGFSTTHRNGVSFSEAPPNANSSALIDIEDSGDGSVTFKYGAVEDLWDLDRLLEFLCGGAFSIHTAESFVPVVIELFRVPVSYTGKRRMIELLSSYIRLYRDTNSIEMEKIVSEVLAEAASEFLPPCDVGSYSRGRSRPYKRFSSRHDKWWRKLDNYFGVGDGSVDFLPEHSFAGQGGYRMQPSGKYEIWNHGSNYEPFKPKFSQALATTTSPISWMDAPTQPPWLRSPHENFSLESPTTSPFSFVRENDSLSGLEEGNFTPGLGFILLSLQVHTLENILRKTELEESASDSDLHFAPPSSNTETLPTVSIQDMVQWEQEDSFLTASVSLPSKQNSRAKVKVKKTTQRIKTKTTERLREKTNSSTKTGSKKKSSTHKRKESQLCDMFFSLPLSHKCSGVASFLAMRKNFSGEMLVVLNQGAVGLAGAGLAVTLHVVARMLSVNSTFDTSKMFGIIRGAALLWLSAAMQSLRKVMLRLPTGCTVSDCKDKAELLRLQKRLRSLSFRAMTLMVLIVVGHGF